MKAILEAFNISTERFASPLNVHCSTNRYFSLHSRDCLFGSSGDAYSFRWIEGYQFNPEYAPDAIKLALQWAAYATAT